MNDYTNGRRFILTHSEIEGERSKHLHYLLPDGKRRKVTIDQAYDTDEWRTRIGEALAAGNTGRTKGK